MTRYLLCPGCEDRIPLHPDDKANGIQMRRTSLIAKKPEDLNIEIHHGDETDIIPVTVLVCDLCNEAIPDGTRAVDVTMWEGPEPGPWEEEYGEVLV